MIRYEWVVETMDGEDVADVDHRDTFAEATAAAERIRAEGKTVEIGLVRDRIAEDENLEDRQWAYVETDGQLPQTFDGGAKVPEKYRDEVRR